VFGEGAAALDITADLGTPSRPLFTGTWLLSFPNRRFEGTLSGTFIGDPTQVGFAFWRSSWPCADPTIATPSGSVIFSVTENRMTGQLFVPGCQLFRIELNR
jgi:hypothetical protein